MPESSPEPTPGSAAGASNAIPVGAIGLVVSIVVGMFVTFSIGLNTGKAASEIQLEKLRATVEELRDENAQLADDLAAIDSAQFAEGDRVEVLVTVNDEEALFDGNLTLSVSAIRQGSDPARNLVYGEAAAPESDAQEFAGVEVGDIVNYGRFNLRAIAISSSAAKFQVLRKPEPKTGSEPASKPAASPDSTPDTPPATTATESTRSDSQTS